MSNVETCRERYVNGMCASARAEMLEALYGALMLNLDTETSEDIQDEIAIQEEEMLRELA